MVSPVGLLDSGLMWPVLEPQPGHYVSSLGKDLLAPNTPPPPSSNGRQKKALFPFLSRSKNPRWLWERTVPKFCAHKIGQNQLNISGAVSTRVFFFFFSVNRFIFSVSFCYFLLTNFIFLKKQYTMVEYKGALDVISKTFRSVGTWYENLIFI